MTLDDLLRDFEAKRAVYLRTEESLKHWTGMGVPDFFRTAHDTMIKADMLYRIARDEGMDAAMLWKLANQ